MKRGLLSGFALAVSCLLTGPARAADCAAILQELDTVSSALSENASAYWSERKTYIEYKRPGAGDEIVRKRRADAAKARAGRAKSAIPQPFARFALLANAAQAAKCLPQTDIKARRERMFDAARRVNFDQLPAELATEGMTAPPARRIP